MNGTWRIGLVGCGCIARGEYLPQIKEMPNAEVVAVCDIMPERAREYAEVFGVPKWYDHVDRMLEGSDFDIMVDTASIQAHYEINLKALQAGKHLYSQKPFTTTVEEADALIAEANKRKLKISASPIHVLRPDLQEMKRIIDRGIIGKVSFARCRASHGGPEYFQNRDVDPSWFYEPGAGPVLDMGVHGLHQVTGLLGPAKRVSCFSGVSEKTRTIRSGAFDGKQFQPHVDDNTLMMLDFGDATFAFVDSTYCVKASNAPSLEIFGSDGTIQDGIKVYMDDMEKGIRGWTEPIVHWDTFQQSAGVKDLIEALEGDRDPMLTPEHARHVIEIFAKAYISAETGKSMSLETSF